MQRMARAAVAPRDSPRAYQARGTRLSENQRHQLWEGIEARELLLQLVATDFHAELELIDREIDAELRKTA
jgi:hypothetical protein